MVGQSGQIQYTEPYSRLLISASQTTTAQQYCIWTIRANFRQKIKLQLTSSYQVTVTEFFIAENGTHTYQNRM